MLDQGLFRFHVAVAAAALVLGLVAMFARKRKGRHTRVGLAYFWTVSAVSVSGAVLAVLDWERNAVFLAIALLTQGLATLGLFARRREGRAWLMAHAAGMVGSYVEISGAFLVNNWVRLTGRHGRYAPEAWLLPGVVGSLALAWLLVGIYRGRLPRA